MSLFAAILKGPRAGLASICCAALVAAAVARSPLHRPFAQNQETLRLLQRLAGGKVLHLPDQSSEPFREFLATHLLTKEESDSFSTSPNMISNTSPIMESPAAILQVGGDAYVWAFPWAPSASYLTLLNPAAIFTPSTAHAWIFIVDKDGAVLSRKGFDIGHRMRAKSASFESTSWLSSKVLVQETRRGFTDSPPLRLSIAFDRLRPVTVRIESLDGSLRRMPYWALGSVVGPIYEPPALTALVQILQCGNDVQQLESLTWLNGDHSRVSDRAGEDMKARERYAEAINSPSIAAAVVALRNSKNATIREIAAQIPLGKPDYDHRGIDGGFRRG